MELKDLNGEASIRKGTKEIMVPLVGDEREIVVKDVADADERKMSVETEKASKNKYWKKEIKNEDLIIRNGCVKLKGGVLREVEVEEYFFWEAKKVYVVRTDTGEVVGERSIKPEETFQDFTNPEMQVKPEDIPEEFKQRLFEYVPAPTIEDERAAAVETDCEIVIEDYEGHICARCLRVSEQPECHGMVIKFKDDNSEGAVLECSNFEDCGDENREPSPKPKKKRKSKKKKK
jgi:hypothetical protein